MHMYVCVYIYVYIHMHTHIFTYILYTYIYKMNYSAIKKNEILPSATMWLELEYYGKQRKSEKDKYHILFTHKWNLRNKQAKGKGERDNPRLF